MLTFFKVLEGALTQLESEEGVEPQEVTEVEVELGTMVNTQHACVNFPEWNYMCFTYGDWREGDFIGYRTDKCYYCGKDEEEGHDCLNAEVA